MLLVDQKPRMDDLSLNVGLTDLASNVIDFSKRHQSKAPVFSFISA